MKIQREKQMVRFMGFWEESFDGLFNTAFLVIQPKDFEEDDGHPLVGMWGCKEELFAEAQKQGILPEEFEIEE